MRKYLLIILLINYNTQITCFEIEFTPQEIADNKKFEQIISPAISEKILLGSGLAIIGLFLIIKRPGLMRYGWVTKRHFDESIKNIESKLGEQHQLLKIIEFKIDLLAQFMHITFNSLHQENQNIINKLDSNQSINKLDNQHVKNYLASIDQKMDFLIGSLNEIKLNQKKVENNNSTNLFKDY